MKKKAEKKAYKDITHSQSEHIPGITDQYNAKTRANAAVCY